MPDHAVQRVEALCLWVTVRGIDLVNITGPIVMPHRGPGERGVVRFRGRCFAVAIVVTVVSDLDPWVGDVSQVTGVVVGESGRVQYTVGRRRGRFTPVLIIDI